MPVAYWKYHLQPHRNHVPSKALVAVQSGIAPRKNRADLDVEHQDVEEGQDAGEDQPGPVVVVEDVVRGEPQVGRHPVHKVPCSEEHVHLGQPELKELGHVNQNGYENDRASVEGHPSIYAVIEHKVPVKYWETYRNVPAIRD